jgi:hypothetical protein
MVYLSCLVLFLFSLRLLISGTKVNKSAITRNMDTTNDDLSRRKAQKRVEMETLVRENERRRFTAMVDCPKCGVFAVHWLERKSFGGVTRQCKDCGHEWRQE